MAKEGLQLSDYEAAVDSAVDQLFLMYKYNKEAAPADRLSKHLLGRVHRMSPYLEELITLVVESTKHLPPQEAKEILDKLGPLLDVISNQEKL